MDPSSLIFVAVIAIWASYLLGHWVRRRDQLATARSIDRFSEAMRVLDRRAPAVAPSPARGHVVAAVRAPRPAADPLRTSAGPVRARTVRPSTTARPVAPQQVPAVARGAASGRISPAAARRRGNLLAGLVAATVLGWVFAGVTPLPWPVPALLTCLLAAFVVGLRRAVIRERTSARLAARATTSALRRSAVPRGPQVAEPRDVRLARRAAVQVAPSAAVTERVDTAGLAAELAAELAGSVETGEPVVPGGEPLTAPAAAGPAFPSAPEGPGWQPVPVPPPTYTLKPKAPAVPTSSHAAAAPEPQQQDAAPIDLDEVIERRIASGA